MYVKLENVLQRAVEPVGPQMRAVCRIDQLSCDAHPVSAFSHRAFEDIADPQLAADLLHVDRAALVGEGRIAGDDEKQRMRESAVMISF